MAKARVVKSMLLEWYEPLLHTRTLAKNLVTPENVGSENLAVRAFRMEPGGTGERHQHEKMEHTFVILEGHVAVVCNDERYDLGPGDVIYIPPKVEHRFNNSGLRPAYILAAYSPPTEMKEE
ncbi:MAG: hypothetical protein AOA65_2219 [Candidatus Bathyarchaeota archaeon BA1]|nr:MAG: hypothetical protein AOA65_2219 [Candidatus Bathyarchaeota archaeon BA1]